MRKRICKMRIMLTSIVFLLLFLGSNTEKVQAETQENITNIMNLTGIMNNSEGIRPADKHPVTRAEFAQMLIQASPYLGEVKKMNNSKLFQDITKSNTYVSYINIAVTKGYMNGYLKGLFKPSQQVTLKEAIYGTLSILGYTNEDFKGKFSSARYETFQELGLSKNMPLSENSKLTTQNCETLFYNLLNAKLKSGEIYGKSLGYTLNNESLVDYDALLTLKSKGPLVTKEGWKKSLNNKLSEYTILQNDEIISPKEIADYSIVYYAEQAKTIWVYNSQVFGILENITYNQGEPQELIISGTSYTIDQPKIIKKLLKDSDIQKNMPVALLLGRDSKVSYLLPLHTSLSSNNWNKELTFERNTGTVYINNNKSSYQEVPDNSLIYYSNELKTAWVFDHKIYGILDGITLTQGEPQEFTIAGTSYSVESSKAMKSILKSSSITANMPVVLLLGWDDKVSKILKLSSMVAEGNWQFQLGFDPNNGSIYKNGAQIISSQIISNDILYYSKELTSIWVYDKKVYGTLEAITPNLSAPESITVGGKTYDLKLLPVNSQVASSENQKDLVENAWGERLRDHEIIEGANVVVLFGCNGKVADIYTVNVMPVTISGYVLNTQNKLIKNDNQSSTIQQVIQIVDTEGTTREFICSDTTIIKGILVEISFHDGKTIITRLNAFPSSSFPSDFTSYKFSEAARILEVSGQHYAKLSVLQMKESSWGIGNVLYYKINENKEITDLVVMNVTDSLYQFGILKKVTFPSEDEGVFNTQLTFNLNGTEATFTPELLLWGVNLGPRALLVEDNKLTNLLDLKEVRISYISAMQANTGNNVYRIAGDVQIYFYKNDKYYKGELSDINLSGNQRVLGYKLQQGPIRIILVY